MAKSRLVIWGAGAIGRGFIADIFQKAGYHITFVDQSAALVDSLNKRGKFTVVRAKSAQEQTETIIHDYSAFSTTAVETLEQAVVACDLMAIAVYPKVFDQVAQSLAPLLLKRQERNPGQALDLLLCTNQMHAAAHFQASLQKACPAEQWEKLAGLTGLVETLIIRICPEAPPEYRRRDPLLVWTNGYPTLHVERRAFRGPIPPLPALRLVDDMRAEETRKMYTYNMAHAVLAYHGAMRGYDLVVECMANERILDEARRALSEAGQALCAAYGFTPEEMEAWNRGVIEQTDNPALRDTVQRDAADPLRKLRRDDRLIGPILLARKHDLPWKYLCRAVAAAFHYDDINDATALSIKKDIAEKGLRKTIEDICSLSRDESDLIDAIVRAYHRLPLELEWEKRAQQAYDQGFENEKVYHGCGQCTLATLMQVLDIFDEGVFSAATSLSGGLGMYGKAACSALTGASMAISLLYPRIFSEFGGARANKYKTFAITQRLIEKFEEHYGSIICHDIHTWRMGRPFDLRSEAERAAFEKAGAHEGQCTDTVGLASRWAIEAIADQVIEDQINAQLETEHSFLHIKGNL